ncbi:MAG: Protein translocase subunit SecA [Candidatus Anoxychlamydiales bacterium]|nr:Protein translocase subunit SecA [Candidatus Anoxychlamydiales bacterium]NGX35623.1 Protein translocase subunit SecA [Candidatus Anoxychlamydiales bacterium]
MFKLLKKIIGTEQSRRLKKYSKIVEKINLVEKEFQKLTEEEIINKTDEFKKRYKNGESVDDLLVEAYATVKNICRKLFGSDIHVSGYDQKWDMIPYDVQLLGAISMHFGSIAEMQTGEGKTLTAAMPLYLNALTGKATHLVTVNDYLAKRDCEWIGTVFRKLKLEVRSLTNDVPPDQRKDVYAADIVYGTASEFGFDYLRDNSMGTNIDEQVQRKPYFAIIDETDSILIDEARTPLIISGPVPESRQMYDELKANVALLVKNQRDLCSRIASHARKTLVDLGIIDKDDKKLKKQDERLKKEALQNFWLVSKGTPRNKVLKRIKENPNLRAEIDKLETYFHLDQNKKEKADVVSELFMIVDERSSEYELTDKGISAWARFSNDTDTKNDFVMLDLGYEYAKVDENKNISEQKKLENKQQLREEDAKRKERAHNLRQLLRAHLLMEKDVDYIISQNEIIIIDENTGRPQPGRRFSDGLHQAIEAKENVQVQRETQTYATITLQNYFRMYDKLAGMTGTAITEAHEFKQIYKLDVLEIPTYCKCERKDSDDLIFMTEREKYLAILKDIKKIHAKGQPMLIGTESVEISEKLSRILKQNKILHFVLNAKNHEKEAEIIANAGKKSMITIATNMAGRGTDIKLSDEVKLIGGLHVMGTTRHHSRRIDRQLRGRSARLGDPGSSQFYVSFEDSLMRLFASPRLTSMLQRFRPPEGEPISAKVLNRSIETAQKRIEGRNFMMRKHTLEYDDVMNKQRQEIYSFRNEIIQSKNSQDIAKEVIETIVINKASEFFVSRDTLWDVDGFINWLVSNFPVTFDKKSFDNDYLDINEIEKLAVDKLLFAFDEKLKMQTKLISTYKKVDAETDLDEVVKNVIKNIMVRKIDTLWQEHLLQIDHLRTDVSLSTVAQKDPLIVFKQESFTLFDEFSQRIKLEIASDLFRFEMVSPQIRLQESIKELQMHTQKSFVPQPNEKLDEHQQKESKEIKSSPIIGENKVGRNDDCPCGSGKKYKKCCGSLV